MRIALISEHASPLAAIAGVDAGGQNVHVAELAAALHRQGHEVTVYTRRDAPDLPETVRTARGFAVVHVPAGPARHIPKDELLPYMRPFGQWLAARWAAGGAPDIVHAHFWMSGVAAHVATGEVPAPVVQTFHALGSVKRRYQTTADTSPPVRVDTERRLALAAARVIAQCTDEVDELAALGVPRSKVSIVASGVDATRFTPVGRAAPRTPGRRRILSVGRLVPRKGFDELVHVLPDLPDAEVVIAGGPPGDLDTDPEARRLRSLATELGVGDRAVLSGVPHGLLGAQRPPVELDRSPGVGDDEPRAELANPHFGHNAYIAAICAHADAGRTESSGRRSGISREVDRVRRGQASRRPNARAVDGRLPARYVIPRHIIVRYGR